MRMADFCSTPEQVKESVSKMLGAGMRSISIKHVEGWAEADPGWTVVGTERSD